MKLRSSLTGITLILSALFMVVNAAAEINISETNAGKAFKNKNYNLAIEELNKLLVENPENLVVLRYIGLSYHRLEQYDKAIEAYERILEIDPENVPAFFYLGATYFNLKQANEASELFQKVIQLSPGSLYAEWAEKYIEALWQQQSVYKRPGKPITWNFYVQASPQTDFNVPEGTEEDAAFRFTEYVSGGLRTKMINNFIFGFDVASYLNQHLTDDNNEDDFDLLTLGTSAYVNYTTTLAGKPFSPELRYDFDYILVDYDEFSNSHSITTSFNTEFTSNTLTVPYYRFTFDNFDEDGFDPDISSRDAVNNAGGLRQYFFFLNRAVNFWLAYEFQHNDADGLNFNYLGHDISVGTSFPAFWKIRTDLSAGYGREDYNDFQGPRDRETNRQDYSIRLARKIKGPIYGTVSYRYINEDSNYETLEFERHIVGFAFFVNY